MIEGITQKPAMQKKRNAYALLVFGVIAQLSYLITDGVTSSITNLIVAACLAIVLLKLIRENTTSNTIIREDLLEPTQEDISEKAVANKS